VVAIRTTPDGRRYTTRQTSLGLICQIGNLARYGNDFFSGGRRPVVLT
jgi:hypothetical protein